MEKFLRFLSGYVKIRVQGEQGERFLNLCRSRGVDMRQLSRREDGSLVCYLSVRHFFLLSSIHKKTKVQIHILEKHGLPFFFVRSKKRKAFFLGILLCAILLFVFSGRIWNIHIEGNVQNSTPEILEFLEEQGVRHGIRKSRVNCSGIAAAVRQNYPEITWVSARIEGTKLILTMQEGIFVQETEDSKEEPCSIAADEDGLIVEMVTRTGVPQVKPGDMVKKGDILVLGRLDLRNDSQEVIRCEYVHADADIYIKRNLSYYAELPMEYEKEIPAGKEKRGFYLKAGDWYLEWGGKAEKGQHRTVEEFPLRITENFVLPVSLGKISVKTYEKRKETYTDEEARAESFQRLQEYEEKLMEKGVQISANNVKIEVDHKTCISSGRLEIIEKIGKDIPVEKLEDPIERTTEDG
ncbi:MAG TPA: sporulation protein YqfD [Candidatus Blautia intestinipullorum]|nr:sporulation protein YqfD [Candidatus Blautia intestinipullorum]